MADMAGAANAPAAGGSGSKRLVVAHYPFEPKVWLGDHRRSEQERERERAALKRDAKAAAAAAAAAVPRRGPRPSTAYITVPFSAGQLNASRAMRYVPERKVVRLGATQRRGLGKRKKAKATPKQTPEASAPESPPSPPSPRAAAAAAAARVARRVAAEAAARAEAERAEGAKRARRTDLRDAAAGPAPPLAPTRSKHPPRADPGYVSKGGIPRVTHDRTPTHRKPPLDSPGAVEAPRPGSARPQPLFKSRTPPAGPNAAGAADGESAGAPAEDEGALGASDLAPRRCSLAPRLALRRLADGRAKASEAAVAASRRREAVAALLSKIDAHNRHERARLKAQQRARGEAGEQNIAQVAGMLTSSHPAHDADRPSPATPPSGPSTSAASTKTSPANPKTRSPAGRKPLSPVNAQASPASTGKGAGAKRPQDPSTSSPSKGKGGGGGKGWGVGKEGNEGMEGKEGNEGNEGEEGEEASRGEGKGHSKRPYPKLWQHNMKRPASAPAAPSEGKEAPSGDAFDPFAEPDAFREGEGEGEGDGEGEGERERAAEVRRFMVRRRRELRRLHAEAQREEEERRERMRSVHRAYAQRSISSARDLVANHRTLIARAEKRLKARPAWIVNFAEDSDGEGEGEGRGEGRGKGGAASGSGPASPASGSRGSAMASPEGTPESRSPPRRSLRGRGEGKGKGTIQVPRLRLAPEAAKAKPKPAPKPKPKSVEGPKASVPPKAKAKAKAASSAPSPSSPSPPPVKKTVKKKPAKKAGTPSSKGKKKAAGSVDAGSGRGSGGSGGSGSARGKPTRSKLKRSAKAAAPDEQALLDRLNGIAQRLHSKLLALEGAGGQGEGEREREGEGEGMGEPLIAFAGADDLSDGEIKRIVEAYPALSPSAAAARDAREETEALNAALEARAGAGSPGRGQKSPGRTVKSPKGGAKSPKRSPGRSPGRTKAAAEAAEAMAATEALHAQLAAVSSPARSSPPASPGILSPGRPSDSSPRIARSPLGSPVRVVREEGAWDAAMREASDAGSAPASPKDLMAEHVISSVVSMIVPPSPTHGGGRAGAKTLPPLALAPALEAAGAKAAAQEMEGGNDAKHAGGGALRASPFSPKVGALLSDDDDAPAAPPAAAATPSPPPSPPLRAVPNLNFAFDAALEVSAPRPSDEEDAPLPTAGDPTSIVDAFTRRNATRAVTAVTEAASPAAASPTAAGAGSPPAAGWSPAAESSPPRVEAPAPILQAPSASQEASAPVVLAAAETQTDVGTPEATDDAASAAAGPSAAVPAAVPAAPSLPPPAPTPPPAPAPAPAVGASASGSVVPVPLPSSTSGAALAGHLMAEVARLNDLTEMNEHLRWLDQQYKGAILKHGIAQEALAFASSSEDAERKGKGKGKGEGEAKEDARARAKADADAAFKADVLALMTDMHAKHVGMTEDMRRSVAEQGTIFAEKLRDTAAVQVRIFRGGRRPPPNECRYMKERKRSPSSRAIASTDI